MKTLAMSSLVLLLSTAVAFAGDTKKPGLSISFNSDDSRTRVGARHTAREARVAVETRSGGATLLLLNDAVAVQLSDTALGALEPNADTSVIEEMLAAGVGVIVRKSVEYPLAHIRSAEIRNGILVLTNDEGKAVFSDIKVNGSNVTRDFSPADAARFVSAFRALKGGR
jgi:hypothetical protein